MRQRELYFWASLLAILNVMVHYASTSISLFGVVWSIVDFLNLSAIVWIALIWPLLLLSRPGLRKVDQRPADRFDVVVVAIAIAISCLPIEYIGWFAVFLLGIGAWYRSMGDSDLRKAGILLFSVTVPQFWSKMIFAVTSHYILPADAALVASITQTPRHGNLVDMPGGGGVLQIAGPCSSFGNISLAFTGWMIVMMYYGTKRSFRSTFGVFAVIAMIIAVNTTRISLIGFFPQYYHILHDEIGSFVVSWILVIIIFGMADYVSKTDKARSAALAN